MLPTIIKVLKSLHDYIMSLLITSSFYYTSTNCLVFWILWSNFYSLPSVNTVCSLLCLSMSLIIINCCWCCDWWCCCIEHKSGSVLYILLLKWFYTTSCSAECLLLTVQWSLLVVLEVQYEVLWTEIGWGVR